ncbi:unnamed protein product [Enterobius vermicularis]|uniref:Sister chromatid cohesion protein DCC1 n=1 Tax=Enterobius vermicularis TaxID=51028 RepID=A0A0N4VB97_ENTVE|nr:unnamed protein product [Enterobius vermicularis]
MDKFLKRKATSPCRTDARRISKATSDNKENHASERSLPEDTVGNLEATSRLFSLAGLDVQGEIQQIAFSPSFASGDFRLVEVTPALADEIVAGTSELVFRGRLDDFPVLCTKNKTYSVVEAETSNTLLLLPELNFSQEASEGEKRLKLRQVQAMETRYLELAEVKSVFTGKLKELLHENEFEWTKSENMEQVEKNWLAFCLKWKMAAFQSFNFSEKFNVNTIFSYTFSDLLNIIQMSECELKDALERLPVIEHNGGCIIFALNCRSFLRFLSSEFRDRLLTELIELLDDDDEADISLSSVGVLAFYNALRSREPDRIIPMEAVKWFVRSHCNVVEKDGNEVYTIDERAICRSKASQLLRAAVRFELTNFENLMKQLLPEGVELKSEYLEGLTLVDEELTRGKTIRYLNVEELPENEMERLELLFSLRQKWNFDDIKPFLSDICGNSREMEELLNRRCRLGTVNSERIIFGLK